MGALLEVTDEILLQEVPTDAYQYVARKTATDLRNHVGMLKTYYAKFDKTSNPKQKAVDQLLSDPDFFKSRGYRIQYINQTGSVRSGKSVMSIAKPLELLHRYPGSKWLMMRRTNAQMMGSIFAQTVELLKKYDVPYKKRNPSQSGPGEITLPNGSQFIFISTESVVLDSEADNARGLGSFEFVGATLEEVDTLHKEAVDTVPQRLSQDTGCPFIIFYNSNPTRKDHWFYKMFHERANLPHPEDYHEFHFTIYDNLMHLKEGYLESLLAYCADKPGLANRMIRGIWGPEIRGNPIYGSHFNRERHVAKTSFLERWTRDGLWRDGDVCLGWDFGWRHPALVVFQDVHIGLFRQIRILAAWLGDEIDIGTFCQHFWTELRLLLPGANFRSYGDPQGENKDPRGVSRLNAFDVIENITGLRTNSVSSDPKGGVGLIVNLLGKQANHPVTTLSEPDIIVEPNPYYTGDICSMFEVGYAQSDKATGGKFKPVDDDYFIHIADALRYGVVNRRGLPANGSLGNLLQGNTSGLVSRIPGATHYSNEVLDIDAVLSAEEVEGYRTAHYNL